VHRPRQPVFQVREVSDHGARREDRVLEHNPVAAPHLADSYYSKVRGPDKPAKTPSLPVVGRRKSE
jgi:hypothetical protein